MALFDAYSETYCVLAHQSTLSSWFWFQDITVMNDDALDRLLRLSSCLLLRVRQDLCMEFCKEGRLELAKRLCRCSKGRCYRKSRKSCK